VPDNLPLDYNNANTTPAAKKPTPHHQGTKIKGLFLGVLVWLFWLSKTMLELIKYWRWSIGFGINAED
jgi:hypothetical protein